MDYKLFEEFITLQALLKEQGIIQSGGAIKRFLTEEIVLFNGENETRRGKKIRIGDTITLPNQDIDIHIVAPTEEEITQYQEEQAEKKRVAELVKKLNQEHKANKQKNQQPALDKKEKRKPVRFPGT